MEQFIVLAKEFLPWLIVASVAGSFNVIAAHIVLTEDCKRLLFFEPHKTVEFWIWMLSQFLLPALGFWVVFSLHSKPALDSILIIKSAIFGLSFVTIANSSSTTIGPVTYSIKPIYDFFVRLVRTAISRKESGRNAEFWSRLKRDIENSTNENLINGLDFLATYLETDVSLNDPLKKIDFTNKLEAIRTTTARAEQSQKTVSLIMESVCRESMPQCVSAFGCQAILNQYFPSYTRPSSS